MAFTKEEARQCVLSCAKIYNNKLLNKQVLIIYREQKDNQIRSIEVAFYKRNFQHLTGLELIDHNGNVIHNQSNNFYRKCIQNKLSINDFQFKKDGTTPLKLAALPALMNLTKITKISGDYNNVRPYLFVDKVVGGVNFCLGLTKSDNFYVPSSALLENIKNLTDAPSQVLAIFQKDSSEDIYSTIKHTSKGINLNTIIFPDNIRNQIDLKKYIYKYK